MPKAIDFTSVSMRAPPGSREWGVEQKAWPGSTDMLVYNAHCVLPGRLSRPPCFAVERGHGRGIECLPLLVREAAHHGRGIFAVDEGGGYSDGLAVYPVAEAVVRAASRALPFRGSCGVEVCGPAVHRVTDLAPPGACAVGRLGKMVCLAAFLT
jgi:hypothetical protein